VEIYRKTWAEIKKNHLLHNLDLIRSQFSSDTFLCPMVKANAYGHGDAFLAKQFQEWGVQNIGVCLIEEGLLLRKLGIHIPILVFRGFDKKGAAAMLEHRLTPVVSHLDQLKILGELNQSIDLHLKFDTGMNRLGLSFEQTFEILQILKQNPQLHVQGLLTHLYQSEDSLLENSQSKIQIEKLHLIIEQLKSVTDQYHVLNSGGIVCKMEMLKKNQKSGFLFEKNWGLRPGLLMYGYNPVVNSSFEFKPALTLKSHTSVVRQVKKGEGVSYNHRWVAEKDSSIAVVPIGYADGWHRLLSNQSEVLWNGQRAPIVGNICMDYLMVDVTGFAVKSENEVLFLGESSSGEFISAFEVAKKAQTIPWEILTSIGERVPRIYL